MDGSSGKGAHTAVLTAGFTPELFRAALTVREQLGKLSDLIHASAIALVIPEILEPDETLERPSLAAGNDPRRLFDLATDRRVAEFKLARWNGSDGMRQRSLFKDAVDLVLRSEGRIPELYVRGSRPGLWLATSKRNAASVLDRHPRTKDRFVSRFGTNLTVAEFNAAHGSALRIVDLEETFPALFAPGVPDQAG